MGTTNKGEYGRIIMTRTRLTTLEKVTQGYWNISLCLNAPTYMHPFTITTEQALKICNQADKLAITWWRLRALLHDLKYDIIEGDTSWRQDPQTLAHTNQKKCSISILYTTHSEYMKVEEIHKG